MKKGGVNPELDSLMSDLLKKVKQSVKAKEAEIIPGLLDIIRLIDRMMAWEKIKHHIKDEKWGEGFNDDPTEGAEE